jgi:mycobactin peptide synthetase MbtE
MGGTEGWRAAGLIQHGYQTGNRKLARGHLAGLLPGSPDQRLAGCGWEGTAGEELTVTSIATSRNAAENSVGTGTVHELVCRHAALRPDAIAVVHGTQRTTYAELCDLSAAYAALLAGQGVRKGDFLPVALPRCLRLVGVILGALRLGAAYALLDRTWPGERIRDVLAQLGADLFVTDDELAGSPARSWSPSAGGPVVGASAPLAEVFPEDPCSVFFTSGSTGRPKGAVSPHSGTARLIDEETFGPFGPHTVMAQAAAQPWDLFSLELWAPLMAGGTTVLIDEPYLSGPLIRELKARDGLNTVWLTTSLFNMVVDEDPACFTGLAMVMVGGERLSPPHIRSFLAAHPRIPLINGFGPVETTIFCSTHRIRAADCDVDGGIPVGLPMPRTRVYVLDDERICADGEVGELCVAGDGLATGYLGDAELTRRKFPTLRLNGRLERVYRTGDLGLREASGLLHYRGRADRQLKIRGQRVEPAEVEHVISGLSGVGRCVVLPRFGPGGDCTGMDAVITAANQAVVDPGALLEQLRTLLPAFSIPSRLIEVAAIPLNKNGKLDETALRDLVALAAPGRPGRPPASAGRYQYADPAERDVAEVFASVLGVPVAQLDPGSTLVELGGTSLDAGRVAARLADALGWPVPASQVFRTPAIRGLAAAVAELAAGAEAAGRAGSDDGAAGPSTVLSATVLSATALSATVLSSMQNQMLIQHVIDPDELSMHCVFGWRIEGRPDRAALRSALSYVHDRHRYLSSAYALDKTGMARPGRVPFPGMRELLVETEQDARAVLDRELTRPFRLEQGHVWRPVFVAVRQVHLTLLGVGVHHIAFDGTSAAIIAHDLSHAYNAYLAGKVPDLPPAPSPAQVVAARQAQVRYADLPGQRDYWRTTMRGVASLDYPGGGESASWLPCRAVRVPLPADLVSRVHDLATRHGVSPFVVYLSAYRQTLAALTGQRDFGIGTPMSQRGSSVLSQAVSCLINVVCLRLRADPDCGPAVAIALTAADVSAAFAAQDVPFEEVVDLAGVDQSGDRVALRENLFGLQDYSRAELDLTGLRAGFFLPVYPGIPSELFAEVYPQPDGTAEFVISYRPQLVSGDFCRELASRYLARLGSYTA